MRRVCASILDAVLSAGLVYLAFRFALLVVPCGELSDCFPLTPIVVLSALAALALYFGIPRLLWRMTLGQKMFDR
jgi:hypothetical protein